MKKTLLLLGLLIMVLLIPTVSANWGAEGDGNLGTGNFKAVGTNQIEMQKELLNIELYRDRAKVSVEYILYNTGEEVTVTAGFPCIEGMWPDGKEIENYIISVDNTEIPYTLEKGEQVDWVPIPHYYEEIASRKPLVYWLTSSVHFKKSESKIVKITYESLYQSGGDGISYDTDYDPDLFTYLLSTGATWKGPIKAGTVNIRAITVDPTQIIIKPEHRFLQDGNNFSWSFTDLEPTLKDNIIVDLNNKISVKLNYSGGSGKDGGWYTFDHDQYYFDFHKYSAATSSVLPPNSDVNYEAANVADSKLGTAWVEGVKGDGIGESLTITLEKPTQLQQIGIIPGYAKSKRIYFANNRVAELTIVLNDSFSITKPLVDDYVRYRAGSPKTYQFIDLAGYDEEIKTIKLIINKVYKGTKYDDTCISEIILRKKLTEKPRVGAG